MPYSEEQALSRLAALCSKGEHCTGELDEKMRRWGLDSEARQRNLDYLVSHQFVDNARFCRAYVNDKVRYDRWGRRKIEQALWAKHIEPDIMAEALDGVTEAEWIEALHPLLRAKWPTIKAATPYERSMKLIKYALGRGFDMTIIRRCIDDPSLTDDE